MIEGKLIAAVVFSVAVVVAVVLSWVLAFYSRRMAWRFKALSYPDERRKQATPMPQWGGLGICLTIIILIGLLDGAGFLEQTGLDSLQLTGFLIGLIVLLVGGMVDDKKSLPAHIQIIFPIVAALIVLATGTSIIQVTNPLDARGFSLMWWSRDLVAWLPGVTSFPGDLMTLAWMIVATYTMKILDGLDGLVDGLTVIGAGLVAALSFSPAYYQPAVATISGIVGGAYLGFLPHNRHPAKQYLGEAGSLIAGFSLGFLAILSTAKIAIALAVLAIPITDLFLVALGRIRRGEPWYKGDRTHLHFRLLSAGVPHRIAVYLLWAVSLAAGVIALTLQTQGKIFLVVALVVTAALSSYVAGYKSKKRNAAGQL